MQDSNRKIAEPLPLERPRRTIRQRFVWGMFIIGALILLAGVIVIWQINRLADAVEVLDVTRERAIAVLQVQQSSTQLIATVNQLLPLGDREAFETEVAQAGDTLRQSQTILVALMAQATADQNNHALMAQVSRGAERLLDGAETMIRSAREGQWLDVRALRDALLSTHQALIQETDELVQLSIAMEEAASEQVASARRAALLYPALAVAFSVFLGILLTWRAARSVVQPVEQLTEGATQLAAGLLDRRVTIETDDELGQLATAFNRMADRLQASYAELERRVIERTVDLERRAVQLQTAAEVARDAAAARELDDLLDRAVNLVVQRFGFYHAGIFLIDERQDPPQAVLRAATGEAGRRMLAQRHSLTVGEVGIVGHVAAAGEPRIALDVGADAVHFKNPILPETRSEMALPLKVGERIIGALDVQSRQEAAFGREDVTVLQTMADQLAVAIENIRLLHETRQTLQDLARERNLLEATLNALPDLFFELDRRGRILDFRAPRPGMLHLPPQAFLGQSVDEVLPEDAATVILDALGQAVESGRHVGAVYALETSQGRGWFELSIAARGDPGAPDARFIALLRDVTERVQAEEALRQRNRELALLNRSSQALSATLELDRVFVMILEEVRHLLGAVAGSVWLIDSETGELVCLHATGLNSDAVSGWRLPPDAGIVGWVARHGENLVVSDTEDDPRHFKGVDRAAGVVMRSILSVPLRVKQDVIGVLQVVDTEPGRFSRSDLTLLEPLAASAAIAIDNARLVDALWQRTVELETRNEELDAFAHSVAHDLKNPLGPIVGFAEVLKQDYATLPDEELRRYLHMIAQSGRRMSNIIESLLVLARVRKVEEVPLDPLDMGDVVAEALAQLSMMIEEHEAEITLPERWPAALGNGPWIEMVWVNYLSNAIKYGGRPPRIELGAQLQPDEMVCFWVRDNGVGLTSEEQVRLFRPFERLDKVRARGHGLGLSIVRRIVERLGGEVGVESQPGRGSVFSFSLPAAAKEE